MALCKTVMIAAGLTVFALAGCATPAHEPGWTGQGATPFGAAEAACTEAAAGDAAAFDACMAAQGWTRGD